MKIRMRNTIQFDEQLEVIDQLYDVEVHEKGDYSYLLFYNEEKEKVVIKFHGQELVMSRFSNPKTIMRFLKDSDSLAYIPTPMGMQEFTIQTSLGGWGLYLRAHHRDYLQLYRHRDWLCHYLLSSAPIRSCLCPVCRQQAHLRQVHRLAR